MRDKAKKIGRIKFAKEVDSCRDGKRMPIIHDDEPPLCDYVSFRETMRNQYYEQIGYDPKQIKPRKTVLNRLKRWWVYLTT